MDPGDPHGCVSHPCQTCQKCRRVRTPVRTWEQASAVRVYAVVSERMSDEGLELFVERQMAELMVENWSWRARPCRRALRRAGRARDVTSELAAPPARRPSTNRGRLEGLGGARKQLIRGGKEGGRDRAARDGSSAARSPGAMARSRLRPSSPAAARLTSIEGCLQRTRRPHFQKMPSSSRRRASGRGTVGLAVEDGAGRSPSRSPHGDRRSRDRSVPHGGSSAEWSRRPASP